MSQRTNAIVVGLGAAGALIAAELAKAGVKVIGLEKGPFYTQDDFRFKFDEIRHFSRNALGPRVEADPITWRANEQQEAKVLPAGRLLGVGTGGTTVRWGAAVFRHRVADFRMRSAIMERFGDKALPEDSTLVDWPISYDDLEPYYDKFEWEIGVAGQAGNISGQIIPGGNPFEAPRRRGYPMPPLRRAPADSVFVEAGKRLGYHPFPQPAAINSVAYNGKSACTYCGFCHGFPCHVGARLQTHDMITAALSTRNLDIRPYARVFRVNRRPDGRVRGVSYFDASGKQVDLQADIVVLACYALENARLLLLSGIDENGQVGKHFSVHNYGWFMGVLPEWTNPFMGPLQNGSVIDDLTSELIPDNDEGVVWGSPITLWTGDLQPIEVTRNLPPHVPRWGKGFKDWMAQNYRRLYKMYSQHSSLPSHGVYCDLDPVVKDQHGLPALRITHDWTEQDRASAAYFMRIKQRIAEEMGTVEWWADPPKPNYRGMTVHDTGTHRMGWDPATSVVDPYAEMHECKGLFATGGGQFPTLPAYNPTETMMALGYLTVARILGRV